MTPIDWRALRAPAAGLGVLLALTAGVLLAMGRVPWCACGSASPVSWDIWSSHNSQHLIDPYSFTHGLHGLVFFALLRPAASRVGLAWRAVAAAALEAAWEVAENTPMVIQHYRETTISLDYTGDTVANSMADIFCCLAGFGVAAGVPAVASAGLFVATEVFLALWIRDSLLLNVLMLVWPIEAVKQWQLGG